MCTMESKTDMLIEMPWPYNFYRTPDLVTATFVQKKYRDEKIALFLICLVKTLLLAS